MVPCDGMEDLNSPLKFIVRRWRRSYHIFWTWESTQYILLELTSFDWDFTLSNCFLKVVPDVSVERERLFCLDLKPLCKHERLSTEELEATPLSWSLLLLKLKQETNINKQRTIKPCEEKIFSVLSCQFCETNL